MQRNHGMFAYLFQFPKNPQPSIVQICCSKDLNQRSFTSSMGSMSWTIYTIQTKCRLKSHLSVLQHAEHFPIINLNYNHSCSISKMKKSTCTEQSSSILRTNWWMGASGENWGPLQDKFSNYTQVSSVYFLEN